MSRKKPSRFQAAEIERPENLGSHHVELDRDLGFLLTEDAPWQSNGGAVRGHKARALPFTLEVAVPGKLRRVHFVGVLAAFADAQSEPLETLGGSIHFMDGEDTAFRVDLVNGRHYGDAIAARQIDRLNGDGTSLETVGSVTVDGKTQRVDLLTIDVPDLTIDRIRFKDLGTPASFILFDIIFELEPAHGCPFHSQGTGVPLSEVTGALRLGDRARFNQALDFLTRSLSQTDLDEARGQALTFAATVVTAALESGGDRQLHRALLDFARKLEAATTSLELADLVREDLNTLAAFMFQESESPSGYLIERAVSILDRNYAKDISDAALATQLGLSTSHFRYLFKQTTGQPFHKYLMALRLEKAKRLLQEDDLSVSSVARSVGFSGLAHFSRAFAQRFSINPTSIRALRTKGPGAVD